MKKGILGYVLSAVFVLVVVAVAMRVSFLRGLVIGTTTPASTT